MRSNTYLICLGRLLDLPVIGPDNSAFESGKRDVRAIDHHPQRQPWFANDLAGAARYLVMGAVYVALYIVLDRLSLVHEFRGLGISLWSPSIGLSVAILLAYGVGFAPLMFVAIFVTDFYVHAVTRGIASITVTAAILATGYAALVWILQHRLGFDHLKRARPKDVIILLVAMPAGIAAISVAYCASLYLMGYLPGSMFWSGVEHLWTGDTVGTVIVVPAIMAGTIAVKRVSHFRVNISIVDISMFSFGLTVAFWMIFGPSTTNEFQFFYLLFLPVIWTAIRLGFEGAALALLVLHVALVAITKFEGYNATDFMAFQLVMLALVATGLLLGALVTERRETEERLRSQRAVLSRISRSATAEAMGFSLAHQISQPLSTVATYLHVARRLYRSGRADPADIANALDKSQAEARRAREILERLKDFLSHGRLELAQTDLVVLASKISQLSAADALIQGVQIKIKAFRPLIVRADPIQIEQVLLNLITNAVEAAAERTDRKGIVTVRFDHWDSIASVSVEDNGPGVEPEIAEHLLEPFQTTKSKGMGLGLALSRQIIEAHGGHLHWVGLKPSGTRFTFELHVEGPERNVA
jgi:two-component system, LuxR family, sensor kinase FixL